MINTSQLLTENVRLLKARANKFAVYGVIVAVIAVILATLLVSYNQFHEYSYEAFIEAQKTNPVLWVLDGMPYIFAFWGQHSSSIMAYEAGALIVDQTNELRAHTTTLEQKAAHEATHDALTDLPNRILLGDRVQQAIHTAQRDKYQLAVLILGFNDFKKVTNTLGRYDGERLLKQVAARLQGIIREVDTVARLADDEFAILLPKVGYKDGAERLAKKILTVMELPFELDKLSLGLQTCIGIAKFPEHGEDMDVLLQRADIAMYTGIKNNIDCITYDPKLDKHSPRHLTLMGELRQAINQGKLVLYYQPKVHLDTNCIREVEALVRWDHETHGIIGPDEFIPLAEQSGLIQSLTVWVLNEALDQCRKWNQAGVNISVSVNLSAHSLLDLEIPDMVAGMLAAHEIPSSQLVLEITETAMMADMDRTMEILTRLSNMGVSLSIDDFGTGFSSLSYLSKLPVSEIKIDKSFVMEMAEDKNNAVIVRTTIDLAHNLGLTVVAEGVETEDLMQRLQEMNCDTLQGYYISRPISAVDFDKWASTAAWKINGS
ncbi:MAG: bifunctional diguanylate cyclase/phosphodiesterase [Gammaproteobacteria bacterium]|nr:bifunctional diguanylate cyclase/phosphodiesterase [Gammaproteobacteria bacterium]